jgi:hypothetical protein
VPSPAITSPEDARRDLVLLLQLADSGELGAIRAYLGHRATLVDPSERARLGVITREEIRHRRCIAAMLARLGSAPDPRRERRMELVGRLIALSCAVGGWFVPMYGAGRLERDNVGEYEHAARLAVVAGLPELTDALLEMAEVEWEHELWFRERAESHRGWRVFPHWPPLPPRAEIRASFAAFLADPARCAEPLRLPWLVR